MEYWQVKTLSQFENDKGRISVILWGKNNQDIVV